MRHPKTNDRLFLAVGITLIFAIIEFFGGLYTQSLALISDGVHMLTDVAALSINVVANILVLRPKNAHMSYGYSRAEVIGALLSGLLLWIISCGLIYQSILRFQNPTAIHGPMVFIVATIGFIANLICMKILHPLQHKNLNIRAAYIHLLSDCLGSIAAMITGAVIFWVDWPLIDPLITLIFCTLMIFTCVPLVKESFSILMERAPNHIHPDQIQRALEQVPHVQNVHHLHVWGITPHQLLLTAHLVSSHPAISLKGAQETLKNQFNITHATFQIEPDHQTCSACQLT